MNNLSKYLLGIGLVLSLVLNGCEDKKVSHWAENATWEHVTLFSTFKGHEIKGRGVLMGFSEDHPPTQVLTAKHVVKMYPNLIRIASVDTAGQKYQAKIEYLFNCSDMAIVDIHAQYMGAPVLGHVKEGDKVFALDYTPKSSFHDYTIRAKYNKGSILTGPEFTPGIWEPTTLVEYANYKDEHGMSGEGVFDMQGHLVGIHSAVSMDGFAVFIPLVEAFAAEERDGWKGDRDEKDGCK